MSEMDEPAGAGDIEEFSDIEEFCAEWFPRVTGMLALYVGNRPAAEELAQEAFARAWERWPRVSAMANPVGWVHVTALNLARSRFRRHRAWRRVQPRLHAAEAGTDRDPVSRLVVAEAVSALPRRQREVILLRYYLDLPTEEIADVTGIAPSTVRVHLSRALDHLRRAGLSDDDDA